MSASEKSSVKGCINQISKLGILAGAGALPAQLARACKSQGVEPFIVAFDGHADADLLSKFSGTTIQLGQTGKAIKFLKGEGVSDIVMIGAVRRPSFSELKPDMKTAAFFAKYGFKALGDDGLLRAIQNFLKEEGFTLHSVQDFMPDLLAPVGVLGRCKPSKRNISDIERGIHVLNETAHLDIGQAAVIQNGVVLGLEGVEGTEDLIKRTGALKRKGEGPVLVKLCKQQQSRKLDLPTIGVDTIKAIHDAGFSGVVVDAGQSLIVDLDKTVHTADKYGLFIIGHESETP